MTVLPIHISGSPGLHSPARPIATVDETLRELVRDMVETMHQAPGVGLAAPQVGVGLQVFVWDYEDELGHHHGHVLNPSLRLSGRREHLVWGEPDEEGCLSLPGLRAPLARYPRAVLSGVTLDGEALKIQASGWLARIFQHEYDHLHGILYRDRLSRTRRAEIDVAIQQAGWGEPGHEWIPGPAARETDFVVDSD